MIKRYDLGIEYNWDKDSYTAIAIENKEGKYVEFKDYIIELMNTNSLKDVLSDIINNYKLKPR